MTDRKLPDDEHAAEECARFARELLDGAVRSLIAVEVQLDVLRRQAEANRPIGTELGRIQSLLREEVLRLRELMQHGPLIPGAMSTQAPLARIVIADDHPIFRDGLRRLLEGEANFKVVGEASDGAEAVKLARELKPDILLLDSVRPSGWEALTYVARPVRVILLATTAESSQIVEALRSGARGILLKDSATRFLFRAIQTVMAGGIWVGPEIVSDLTDYLRMQPALEKARESKLSTLSQRELEIVQCLAEALTNREIADRLGLSQHTVKDYLFRIFEKTGTSSRLELMLFLGLGKSSGRPKVADLVQYLRTVMQPSYDEARQEKSGLTPRELEIVSAVAAGYSNKEIAEYFKISEDTVKHHLGNIFDKLGVSSRLELTLYWLDKKSGGPDGGDGGPEGGDAAGIAVIKPRRPNLNRGSAAAKPPGWPQA